jgi:glyceraldehyde-3-phosphate dehydrogenase/erythrose-4-phosphate dehydrogenase
MSQIRVGINGFGRIGRAVFKQLARSSPALCAHMARRGR